MPLESFGFRRSRETVHESEGGKQENETHRSILPAIDLVERIGARLELDLNEYQRSCRYASVHIDGVGAGPVWDIGDLDGYLSFYRDLPSVVGNAIENNAQVLFFGSESDIPLDDAPERQGNPVESRCQTPDGIIYRINRSSGRPEVEILSFTGKNNQPDGSRS